MRTPLSTYRVQLQPGFGFDEVAALAPYLADLGVTHVYCSPYLQAGPGSTHGYDVVDHARVNEELGGAEAHARMCEALGAAGLGQVLDVVPNHMAIPGPENRQWWDVLENGQSSLYAAWFDVDWRGREEKLHDTVLMPILGDHYGRVLEQGDLRIEREGGRFQVRYFDHRLPVAPRSLDRLLGVAAAHVDCEELEFLARSFGRLPIATSVDDASKRERHTDKEVLAARLAEVFDARPDVAEAVDGEVAAINADADTLDELLERQNYRLAHWRTAGAELDYRRFFDVTTLVGLRVEDPAVFEASHALILGFVADGVLDGLRIDHPDGLADPAAYLRRLAERVGDGWIVAEKILEPGEELPPWPIAGTTGYDSLNAYTGLLVDPAAERELTDAFIAFTGLDGGYEGIVQRNKSRVLREALATDLGRLTELFVAVCERHRRYRDYSRAELRDALREVLAAFPVYRSYVETATGLVTDDDVAHVEAALAVAAARRPDLDTDLLELLRDLLLLRHGRTGPEGELALRFQQTSGPAMAKGVEDTTFYTYVRLLCLNEVGGDPGRFGTSPAQFHERMAALQADWPTAMTTSSTHDTKRSEDVRARIAVLSEVPGRFAEMVRRWSTLNEAHRKGGAPDPLTEWVLYQTLVGAWPLPADRAGPYLEKATREAKVATSWTDPDTAFDEGLQSFVAAVLDDPLFSADLEAFVQPLVRPGWSNALAQALWKLAGPGVPDTYQGQELWDLSLVDPDNRREVDFEQRRALLGAGATAAEAWTDDPDTGGAKLALTTAALRLRRRRPDAFGAIGAYEPIEAVGERAAHAVAFARAGQVVAIGTRLPLGLERGGGWGDTTVSLPPGSWTNLLDGTTGHHGQVEVAVLLEHLPVALLEVES